MDIIKASISPPACHRRPDPFGKSRRNCLFLLLLLLLLPALPCSADWMRSYSGINWISAIVPVSPDGFVAVDFNRVLRFDGHGDVLWATMLQDEGSGLYFGDCALTPEGDIVVAGTSGVSSDSPSGVIIRLDDTGDIIWTRKLAGIHSSRLEKIVVSSEGLIFAVGTLDPESETEALLLAALTSSGDIEWEGAFDSFRSRGFGINLASNGDLLVAGTRVYQQISITVPVDRAFVLRLGPDSTGIWGLYHSGPSEPEDTSKNIPMAVLEADDGGILAGLIEGNAGMSGSTAIFWRASSHGYPEDSWYSPDLESLTGGFAARDSGQSPVFLGTFAYPETGSWIWADPSPEGGSWARTLFGPFGPAFVFRGCFAANGDLVFAGSAQQAGAVIWRTSPEGLMPHCELTEESQMTSVSYSPELYHGSADLSPIQIGVEALPITVEPAVIDTSFICGDATAAPRIPMLSPENLLLLALSLLGAGFLILRSSRL